jgi:hypothetical protein
MTLAFSSKHPHVPNPKSDPNASRWIASLSDGTTVFEDYTPGARSAWARLRDYIEVHKLKVTNLRLEAYGRNVVLIPYKDDEGNAQVNGYWHSKQMNTLLHAGGVTETECRGIGILKGKEIWITWVQEQGTTRQEVREYKPGDKAVVVNDPPV